MDLGFYNTEKNEKLNNLIKFHGRLSYGKGETKELILKLLNKPPFPSSELSNILGRKPITIHYHLRNLRDASKVRRFIHNNKILWKVV